MSPRPQVLLVVGPGRSGTSAVSGSLAHSGYHVPDAIKAGESNPRGFYEPRWLVAFDKQRLKAANVGTLDRDPAALDALLSSLEGTDSKARLRAWVEEQLATGERLVLKDPRMIWFQPLWAELATELDFDLKFLIMLRHPSEVSSSRSTYYNAEHVRAVTGWINVALMTERLTRGSDRAFVHYPDLLGDWRREFRRVDGLLGLDLEPSLEEHPHPVDGFLDPSLRRMPSGWDGVVVPGWMRDLADRSFDALKAIADSGEPADHGVTDALSAEYNETYEAALEMSRSRHSRMRKSAAADAAEDVQPNQAPGGSETPARRTLRDRLRRA
ncbi:sulfotransferase family protein [Nocardioides nematodiphilus]|uniref:sulfotransferase family protein n=1 Tax=Nocardioides nematodiphilus TaxID=2849669 RepID=UPI001CD9257E|nr:hypothetical protein [Nocardioides nematodiphilus]MCA1981619.1 hypothetical protein [Nocardioides nematodiphilus]